MTKLRKLRDWLRKSLFRTTGCLHGHGWCFRCERRWCQVDFKYHVTDYSLGQGCFPLCEKCWRKLGTPEARLPFYRMHYERNYAQLAEAGFKDDANWDDIVLAVHEEGDRDE